MNRTLHIIISFILFQKNRPSDYRHLPQIPVMLISYEMFVRYYDDISQIHFDLIVCDEGHRLKNTTIRTYAVSWKDKCIECIMCFKTSVSSPLNCFLQSSHLSASLSLPKSLTAQHTYPTCRLTIFCLFWKDIGRPPVYKSENTAIGIHHADHVAPSIRKGWH
jgi:hypothetical protein